MDKLISVGLLMAIFLTGVWMGRRPRPVTGPFLVAVFIGLILFYIGFGKGLSMFPELIDPR